MFRFLVILAIMFPSFAYGYECNQEIDELSKQYNISIFCKVSSLDSHEEYKYEEAEESMIDAATPSLRKFLSTYDKAFLKGKVDSIMLFKNLRYLDSRVGGLSDGDSIWLNIKEGPQERLNNSYYAVLQHEFSSNVYKHISFTKRVIWKKISFIYHYTVSFIKKCLNDPSFATSTTEELLSGGFINNYSLTNDENDFNVYAETLFTEPEKLKKLKATYPNVKIKLEKLKEFYRELGFKGKFPDET